MLKLEKLEVSGFKSFADRTELRFDEGITAVVGPNGCGKSNIADAIAWVLGEQSAKSLRSSKMEDVIFNGARDRKPLGMAEVSLYFLALADITDDALTAAELVIPEPPVVEGLDPEPVELRAVQPSDPPATVSQVAIAPDGASAPQPVAEGEPAAEHKPKHHRHHTYREAKPPKIAKGERITLTRRLHRSGESDYLLNGKSCRLRDIQQLFAGTGLSGAHYAIVEQGDIDRVLSSKPQERRAIIEEAAGVSIFRIKKRAAELRLESSRQNLSRLNDIISEIERQIGSLKRQAARARRYKRLREQLRALQAIVFREEAQRLQSELDALQHRTHGIAEELASAETILSEKEDLFSRSNAEARAMEASLDESRRALSNLELEIERSRSTSTQHAAEIEHAKQRIAELEREQRAATERFELIDRQADLVREQTGVLDEELSRERQRLSEMSAEYQRALDRLQMAEQEIEELRQQLYSAVAQLDRLQHESAQNEEMLKKSELRRRQLESENGRASERKIAAASEFESLSIDISAGQQRLEELARLRQERSSQLEEHQARHAAWQETVATISKRREALAHRLESLDDLNSRHSYYNEAVQQVLLGTNGRYTAIGTVADFVRVRPEYEEFAENFLGDILQCVLVPTTEDALGAIAHLGTQSGGRATFLVAGLQGGESPRIVSLPVPSGFSEGAAAASRRVEGIPASEILQIKPGIAPIFEAAFPDEWNALMVASVERAIELSLNDPARLYVSARGETVKCGRVIRGGNSKPSGKGLLALRREISELRAQEETCAAECIEASASFEHAAQMVGDLTAQIARLTVEGHELERQLFEQRVQAEHLQKEIERAEQQLRVVAQELEMLDVEDGEIRAEIARASERMTELESMRQERETALREERERYQSARDAAAAQNEGLARLRAAVATTEERRRNLAADLKRLDDEHDDLEQRISSFRFEEIESRERITSLCGETAQLAQRLEALMAEQEQRNAATNELSGRLQSVREGTAALEIELKTLRQQTGELKEQRSALDVESARHQAEAEYLRQNCLTELGVDLGSLLSESLEQGGEQSEVPVIEVIEVIEFGEGETHRTKLDDTRRKLDELGPVNMVALEELVESEERFKFLTTQRDDVLKSIAGTEQALAEIKRRSRSRFLEAFEAINSGFKQSFAELFGGGRGEMTLLDEEDVLESGIEIIAQPPGKRLQNVLLLSGGEKALSAIALILAIFKFNPSPFCLMDEVDASLDEMNVGRFCDKIQQLTTETQFIVITHTKRTMESAKAIYGVTMEEPGVSKLLSVKFG